MKDRTRKLLLIITIILALGTIIFKTLLNSGYYNLVRAINNNYKTQNPIDYQDEEVSNSNDVKEQDISEVNEENDTETVDNSVVEDSLNEFENNNEEEETKPLRPTVNN